PRGRAPPARPGKRPEAPCPRAPAPGRAPARPPRSRFLLRGGLLQLLEGRARLSERDLLAQDADLGGPAGGLERLRLRLHLEQELPALERQDVLLEGGESLLPDRERPRCPP